MLQSSEPDARSDSPIGGECYIKGYPGNTDPSLPAGTQSLIFGEIVVLSSLSYTKDWVSLLHPDVGY